MARQSRNIAKIDWVRVIVHFICGAIFGFFIGLAVGMRYFSFDHILLIILAFSLSMGFIAAVFGDRFWNSLSD